MISLFPHWKETSVLSQALARQSLVLERLAFGKNTFLLLFYFSTQPRGTEPLTLVKSVAALTLGSDQPRSVPLSQSLHLGLSCLCC